MHSYGVMHRDIKAENMVFRDTPAAAAAAKLPPQVKIIDLGMAALFNAAQPVHGAPALLCGGGGPCWSTVLVCARGHYLGLRRSWPPSRSRRMSPSLPDCVCVVFCQMSCSLSLVSFLCHPYDVLVLATPTSVFSASQQPAQGPPSAAPNSRRCRRAGRAAQATLHIAASCRAAAASFYAEAPACLPGRPAYFDHRLALLTLARPGWV